MINVTDTLKQLDGVLVTADVEDNLGKKERQFLYYNKKWWNYPSFTSVDDKDYIKALEKARRDTKSHREQGQIQSPGVSIVEKHENINIPDYIQVKSNPVEIVCTTALTPDEFWDTAKVAPSLERMRFETNFNGSVKTVNPHVFYENKTGLSELYNTFLTDEYKDHYIVFVHDDIMLEDSFLIDKLHDAHQKFDVVGLAGCREPKIKKPALWHLMAEQNNRSGFVSHPLSDEVGNPGYNKFSMSSYGISNASVDLLDGLFLSVNVNSVLDKGVDFDEEFDFHFYDLAFSMRCKDKGVSMGTWPIFVRHYGMGQPDDNWHSLQDRFIEKYG